MTVSRMLSGAAVLAVALAGAGCRATLDTGFVVSDVPGVAVEAVLLLDPVAASGFADDDLAELVRIMERRAGQRVTVVRGEAGLRLSAPLTYSALQSVSSFTGVAAASLELIGDSEAVLTVELVSPEGLVDAIVDSVASQPDAEALSAAMLRFTTVGVSVRFPGQVIQVVAPVGVAPSASDGTVRVVQPLDRFAPGVLTVAGSLVPERSRPIWPAAVVVLLSGVAALVWWRRP